MGQNDSWNSDMEVNGVRTDALEKRVDSHEAILHEHASRLAEQGKQQAVLNTEFMGISRDVSALVDELKATNRRMDQRLGRLTQAAWGLFLVLLPIAVSLVVFAINQGGP